MFGRTKKPAPAAPHAEALRAGELAWLEQQRQVVLEMGRILGLRTDRMPILIADDLVRWWHAQPPAERIDANVIVNAAGVALGDALAEECGLAWRIVTDAHGTDLALWREPGAVVVAPTGAVAGAFAAAPDGLLQQMFRQFRNQIQRIPS